MQVKDGFTSFDLCSPNRVRPENDHAFPVEARRQAEDLLVKIRAQYYIQVFSGASHGFGARADISDDAQRALSFFWQRIYSCHFDRLCERGMCPWILALVQQVCGVVALYYSDRHVKYCAFLTNCIICITKDVYHHRIPLIVSVLGKTDGTQDQWAQCRRRTHEASRLAITDVRRELEDRDCLVWPK